MIFFKSFFRQNPRIFENLTHICLKITLKIFKENLKNTHILEFKYFHNCIIIQK